MSGRYAVYFSPDDASGLAGFGQRVLGLTADGDQVSASADDFPDRQLAADLSAAPAWYGFHATLKAPFALSDGAVESDLFNAVEHIARQQTSIVLTSLQVMRLSTFAALGFTTQPPAVGRLAAQCVEQLESFRAPLTDADLRKRNPDSLTDIQKSYLFRFGYPYVMDEFRFHMTLTGPMNFDGCDGYVDWLKTLYGRLVPEPPLLDRLAVFWQPDRETAFRRVAQFPFSRCTGFQR